MEESTHLWYLDLQEIQYTGHVRSIVLEKMAGEALKSDSEQNKGGSCTGGYARV